MKNKASNCLHIFLIYSSVVFTTLLYINLSFPRFSPPSKVFSPQVFKIKQFSVLKQRLIFNPQGLKTLEKKWSNPIIYIFSFKRFLKNRVGEKSSKVFRRSRRIKIS